VRGVLDAFAVVLRLDWFSKEVKVEHAQEQEVVAQEAEGSRGTRGLLRIRVRK
jgi:hypothetical protein